jgi:hypothetical protein
VRARRKRDVWRAGNINSPLLPREMGKKISRMFPVPRHPPFSHHFLSHGDGLLLIWSDGHNGRIEKRERGRRRNGKLMKCGPEEVVAGRVGPDWGRDGEWRSASPSYPNATRICACERNGWLIMDGVRSDSFAQRLLLWCCRCEHKLKSYGELVSTSHSNISSFTSKVEFQKEKSNLRLSEISLIIFSVRKCVKNVNSTSLVPWFSEYGHLCFQNTPMIPQTLTFSPYMHQSWSHFHWITEF